MARAEPAREDPRFAGRRPRTSGFVGDLRLPRATLSQASALSLGRLRLCPRLVARGVHGWGFRSGGGTSRLYAACIETALWREGRGGSLGCGGRDEGRR